MRLLCVQPGSVIATGDVYAGLVNALADQGHEVIRYGLDVRIPRAQSWMYSNWKQAGKPGDPPTWEDALYLASIDALERALHFDVNGVLIVAGGLFHPRAMELMKRAGIHIGVVLTESPYESEHEAKIMKWTDVAWTNDRSALPMLKAAHPTGNVHYLRHAYDPERHNPDQIADESAIPAHDVVFVGTGWQERIELFSAVDWTGIDFGLYGLWRLGSRHRLRQYLKGKTMLNHHTVALYRKAKIGINLHRSSVRWTPDAPRINTAVSLNPRAYELAASGCFYLSDWREELPHTFGDSVPTFTTPDELGALIRRYLNAPEDRAAHAKDARGLVAPHTFAARAAQITAELPETWERSTQRSA